ncbi:glycosyltransferase [uncultured Erythrobacter sp.]|uniref:glycosyltransferase n=1 Tax=uncultured Erythrobacter sp. TaxID=263913 RepID=UPI0026257A09|nr:glycosyltransferase [uncultured Erythrobacter sp.]
MSTVTILVPTLNEEEALPATIASLKRLNPAPDEILIVDGGSEDRTLAIAEEAGLRTVNAPRRGRGAQINYGVREAIGEIVCVLHADSELPTDGVLVIDNVMADERTALASFLPRLVGKNGTRWGTTFHNYIKTWYAPLITRPHLFVRGVRLLFGDHAMFFRKEDFLRIGGCDERLAVMEEAGLCINFAKLGRTRIVYRWVTTSDRRIEQLGRWRANYVYLKVGLMWSFGVREGLAEHYPDIR